MGPHLFGKFASRGGSEIEPQPIGLRLDELHHLPRLFRSFAFHDHRGIPKRLDPPQSLVRLQCDHHQDRIRGIPQPLHDFAQPIEEFRLLHESTFWSG